MAAIRGRAAMVKPGYRLREGDQVATHPTTIPAIMMTVTFALGVSDVRSGRGFRADFDLWKGNDQWAYERGRTWGLLAPRSVPLKRNGEITAEAVSWYARHREDIL
jgi:hypothetical protein